MLLTARGGFSRQASLEGSPSSGGQGVLFLFGWSIPERPSTELETSRPRPEGDTPEFRNRGGRQLAGFEARPAPTGG